MDELDGYAEELKNLDTEIQDIELTDEKEKTRALERGKYLAMQFSKNFDALKLVEDFYILNPFFYDHNQIFWLWREEDATYQRIDDIGLLNSIRGAFDLLAYTSTSLISNIMNGLKMIGREHIPPNPPENWVQYGKTIFDVKTLKEFSATPKYFHTNSLPYAPSDSPDTPTMDKIFKEWIGDKGELGQLRTLYEIIAYCTYRGYPLHHVFCFVGAGSNGKSKFLQLLRKFIGLNNCCSTELDVLLESRFESSSLYKKLVCIMGETNFSVMSKTSLLKKLTGEDLISFEFKNKMPFHDNNYAKILISTNTLPETTDKTYGFYRRWIIIDFFNTFSGEKDVLDEIPEQEYHNLSRKCMNYLHDLLFIRSFTNIGDVEYRKNMFEDRSNPLKKFLDVMTVPKGDGVIPRFIFAERFNAWLKANNLRQRSDIDIGASMRIHGFEAKRVYVTLDGEEKNYWCWLEIAWKEDAMPKTVEEKIGDTS